MKKKPHCGPTLPQRGYYFHNFEFALPEDASTEATAVLAKFGF